ncbi:MAG: hypothetical protein QOJ15_896, partial [Bradyrhizobium sp.]|nr:hypothetical protein [Bradyrhizobium sp.]
LLPVTAVAGETRDFPRRDRTDLAQADLGHHSIKAGARDTARRRAPEIVIDRFDARPAQRRQTIAHRILQGAALAIVENLIALRCRWCGLIFSDVMTHLLPFPSEVAFGVAEDQADHQLRQRMARLGGQRLPLRRLRRGVGRVAEQN